MPEPIDLAAVSRTMLELEDQSDDPDPNIPVGRVAAKVLDIEYTDEWVALLSREAERSVQLVMNHYSRFLEPNAQTMAALGLCQGIMLAAAIEKVKSQQ